jgi:hypothetical protein
VSAIFLGNAMRLTPHVPRHKSVSSGDWVRSTWYNCEAGSGDITFLPNLEWSGKVMVLEMPRRESTPERWRAALARARKEGVEVRQLVGSGGWIATSGTNQRAAYELDVTGGVVHGCACPAALHDDPVCKHRAAYWVALGIVDPAQIESISPVAA